MVKKKAAKKVTNTKVNIKKEKVLDFILDIVENQSKNIIDFIKRMVKMKEKIRKIVFATGLGLAGLIVLVLGLANYIGTFFPNLQYGVMQIIVGAVAIVIAVLYKKS